MPFWLQEYNLKYVDLIEEQLNEALTTYRKPVDGDNYVRRSNQRWGDVPCHNMTIFTAEYRPNVSGCFCRLQRPNVYLPVHLYGQLVHDKTGCHLLEAQVTTFLQSMFCDCTGSAAFLHHDCLLPSSECCSWPQLHGPLPDAGHLGGH